MYCFGGFIPAKPQTLIAYGYKTTVLLFRYASTVWEHLDCAMHSSRVRGPDNNDLEKVMKVVASTDEYTIYQRRDGRYAVKNNNKAPVNGDEKVAILLQHDLIKAPPPPAPEEPAEEESADATEAEATEEAADEEAAEEGGDKE